MSVGDTWHYQYTGPEGYDTERIVRSEPCGSTQCNVDNDVNAYSNDTAWDTTDWAYRGGYCTGCDGANVITSVMYNPPLQLYAFPLQVGKSWWWNSTASGWTMNSLGNQTFAGNRFSTLRKVVNETGITVPAGTFDAFLVAQYGQNGTVLSAYRWFSLSAKTTVKLLTFDNTGRIVDSYVMLSYTVNHHSVTVECRTGNTCSIQSNFPLSGIRFAGNTIHFTANGPSGATGYANITVPATAIPHKNELKVFVDNNELPSSSVTVTTDSTGTNYYVYFTFTFHSPVIIDIQLGATQNPNPSPAASSPTILGLDPTIFYGLVGAVVVVLIAITIIGLRSKRRSRNPAVM